MFDNCKMAGTCIGINKGEKYSYAELRAPSTNEQLHEFFEKNLDFAGIEEMEEPTEVIEVFFKTTVIPNRAGAIPFSLEFGIIVTPSTLVSQPTAEKDEVVE